MSLPTSYLSGNYNKIPQYFETIQNAQAPEKFTVKFLKDLGFTSSADIQFINILKSLGFLDDSGTPLAMYFQFFDHSISKKLIAQGIRSSYSDLFALNVNANKLSREEVKSKFRVLTAGQKSDSTLTQMVSTFLGLCAYADWTEIPHTEVDNTAKVVEIEKTPHLVSEENSTSRKPSSNRIDLNYDIHIHLPATRDERVYDALFSSLSKYIALK